jgi:hypothetical protein
VATTGICRAAHVFIDTKEFVIDLFVIPLDGYDAVLGVHWLRTLGPILWDFAQARMTCWRDDHRVVWQGSVGRTITPVAHSLEATDILSLLLEEFSDIFATPTRLPPTCRFNHRIHLLPGKTPIAVRPYRYPQLVKDKLERQCHDMLK